MVCACLITSEEKMETIRVLLQSGNYNGRYRESVELTADCAYTLEFGEKRSLMKRVRVYTLPGDSEYYQDSDRVFLTLSANTGPDRTDFHRAEPGADRVSGQHGKSSGRRID